MIDFDGQEKKQEKMKSVDIEIWSLILIMILTWLLRSVEHRVW